MKDQITLTKEEFDEAFSKVVDHIYEALSENMGTLIQIGMVAAVVSADLKSMLFGDEDSEDEDDITEASDDIGSFTNKIINVVERMRDDEEDEE